MHEARAYRLNFILRRAAMLILVAGSTAAAGSLMSQVIAANGLDLVGCTILALFTVSFAWLTLHFWSAVFGFIIRLTGGDPARLTVAVSQPLRERTAVIMPIYNEDLVRVAAGLRATISGLPATGEAVHFDFFILSDTDKASLAASEETMVEEITQACPAGPRIYYRHRDQNVGRKAGNIEDFVRRWGASYAYMVVLDADSVMSGKALVALARLMEAHPDTGIIQTLPIPANRETAFARILQFASRLYGPMLAQGFAFWTGGESNYYGHNAIIRVAAFAKHCGLPILPGKAPLGGEILSHDFVESALMSGGGYEVWFVPELPGSYEEIPANMLDYIKRDRRWCQGNIQHSRLLGMPGLKLMGRLHLGLGVCSYITSPLWLSMLVLSTIAAMQRAVVSTVYFHPGFNLFPNWPVATDFQIDLLLSMTLVALFLPRLLATVLVLFDGRMRRSFGGFLGLWASVLIEVLFSTLVAPVLMLFQSLFISAALLGRSVRWETQTRDDRDLSWSEGWRRLSWQTLIGVAWSLSVWIVAPDFFWWLTPIWSGLVAAVPLSVWSSQARGGHALRRAGLFLTPEETYPPFELRSLRRTLARNLKLGATAIPTRARSLVPAESGLAMPRFRWRDHKPQTARKIEYDTADAS